MENPCLVFKLNSMFNILEKFIFLLNLLYFSSWKIECGEDCFISNMIFSYPVYANRLYRNSYSRTIKIDVTHE